MLDLRVLISCAEHPRRQCCIVGSYQLFIYSYSLLTLNHITMVTVKY